jgi:hypothetical protein
MDLRAMYRISPGGLCRLRTLAQTDAASIRGAVTCAGCRWSAWSSLPGRRIRRTSSTASPIPVDPGSRGSMVYPRPARAVSNHVATVGKGASPVSPAAPGPLSRAGEGWGEGREGSGLNSPPMRVQAAIRPDCSHPSPCPSPARERGPAPRSARARRSPASQPDRERLWNGRHTRNATAVSGCRSQS